MSDLVGQQLGNYRLQRLLGTGGFGDVYLGEHIHLKTQAAIKVLQARLGRDDMQSFLQEARTVAQLDHPHITRILEFGIEQPAHTPFLVMTYAPNGTVRQRHARGQRVALDQVVAYVRQIAEALQYAHSQRFIHRDVKPENFLLGRNHEVLLSDFGTALLAQTSSSQSTKNVMGTAAYMAPEQLQGKPVPASDQYSLAVVVYEWLCGSLPFQGSFMELYSQHLNVAPVPLNEKIPGFSPDIAQVVQRALAKEPRFRFPDMQAFADALARACEPTLLITPTPGLAPSSVPLAPEPARPQAPSSPTASTFVSQAPAPPVTPPPGFSSIETVPNPRPPAYPTSGYGPQPPYNTPRSPSGPPAGSQGPFSPSFTPPFYQQPTSSYGAQPPLPRHGSSRKRFGLIGAIITALLIGMIVGTATVPTLLNKLNAHNNSGNPSGTANTGSPTSGSTGQTNPTDTPATLHLAGAETLHPNLSLQCSGSCDDPVVFTIQTIVVSPTNHEMIFTLSMKNHSQTYVNCALNPFTLQSAQDPTPLSASGGPVAQYNIEANCGSTNNVGQPSILVPGENSSSSTTFTFVPYAGISYTLTAVYQEPTTIPFAPVTLTF